MIFLFKIFGYFLIVQNVYGSSSRCLIQNRKYLDEYLFISQESNDMKFIFSTANLYPFDEVDNLNKVKWNLLANADGTFYIKNEYKNDAFLCSSDLLDPFKKRRHIYISPYMSVDCKWRLVKVNNETMDEKEYYIRNELYGEQLYAESVFFKSSLNKRNIYLWSDKKKLNKSNKFKWIIMCSNLLDLL
jgi:hypothetical protein